MSAEETPREIAAVEHGHQILRYRAPEEPGLNRTQGGFLIASLGTAGDESDHELRELLRNVTRTLCETSTHTRIVARRGLGQLSDALAPALPEFLLVQSPIQWVFHRGIAVDFATHPHRLQVLLRFFYKLQTRRDEPIFQTVFLADEPSSITQKLADLLHTLGVEVQYPEDETATILCEVQRPEGFILSALSGTPWPFSADSTDTNVKRINQQKDRLEIERDDVSLERVEQQERDYLIQLFAASSGVEVVRTLFRSPRLCRLLRDSEKQRTEHGFNSSLMALLDGNAPLFFMKEPNNTRMDLRSFDKQSDMLVVYSDVRCLQWAAEDLGRQPDSFEIKALPGRDLFQMAVQRAVGIAVFAYDDRAMPRCLFVRRDSIVFRELDNAVNTAMIGAEGFIPIEPIRIEPAYRPLRVSVANRTVANTRQVIANTRQALVLHEQGQPPRYYFRRQDIHAEFEAGNEYGNCPIKGRWHSLHIRLHSLHALRGDTYLINAAWSYYLPTPECAAIKDYIAFDSKSLEIADDPSNTDPEHHPDRNCPCGSGLDFLQCHGAEVTEEKETTIAKKKVEGEIAEVNRLCNKALKLIERGAFDYAIKAAQRALSHAQLTYGVEHVSTAKVQLLLANIHRKKSADDIAVSLVERALATLDKLVAPEHLLLFEPLSILADIYQGRGDDVRAEPYVSRIVSILTNARGSHEIPLAAALNKLGSIHAKQRRLVSAINLLSRSLAIYEQKLGSYHRDVGALLCDLGTRYSDIGDFTRAEPLLKRALVIAEQTDGPTSLLTAGVLHGLGWWHWAQGDYAQTEPFFRRALTIMEQAFGPDHPRVAVVLNNLADLSLKKEDYAAAEPLLFRAIAIMERHLGPEHADIAWPIENLAFMYMHRSFKVAKQSWNDPALKQKIGQDFASAESFFHRALSIRTQAQGPQHPDLIHTLRNLALLYAWGQGDVRAAVNAMKEALAIEEHYASATLTTGSDEQKQTFMATLNGSVDLAVTLAPGVDEADVLALTTILRRKGRVLDVMADSLAALRRQLTGDAQLLLDELRAATTAMSSFMLRGQNQRMTAEFFHARLEHLDARRQAIESELVERFAECREELQSVTVEDVRSALPPGTALVEVFLVHARSHRGQVNEGRRHFVAYVLHDNGEIACVELGEAEIIEAVAERWKQCLSHPATYRERGLREFGDITSVTADPYTPARELDRLIMQPIRDLLGTARFIFLSPDGALNNVPFQALIDEEGRYLIERYSITYLASGRDLVRIKTAKPSRQDPIVFAAPDYNVKTSMFTVKSDGDILRSADMRDMQFRPLEFAAEEGRAVAGKLAGATLLMGGAATPEAIKSLHGPRILHIATHGFFLPDLPRPRMTARIPNDDFGGWVAPTRFIENPLVRAGLALAGANHEPAHREEDGVLTALELSQIDLIGTKLVVLSACQTGLGEVRSGDGVYGLRRAIAMAGAETQVMSLWNVDDAATSELMQSFYDRLLEGMGRTEALRQAQLAMMRRPERAHPFYWASFIVSGNPGALDGTLVTANPAEK